MLRLAFVPTVPPTASCEPGHGPLDDPAVLAQSLGGPNVFAGEAGGPKSAEPPPGMVVVVVIVRMEFASASPPWFPASPGGRNTAGERLQAPRS
jgi:hypothetical protein